MSVSAVQQSDSVKDVYVQLLSFVQLFATLWTVALRAPLSMGFSWQEYWSGLPFPPPGDPPNPGIQPISPGSSVFFTAVPPGNPDYTGYNGLFRREPAPLILEGEG